MFRHASHTFALIRPCAYACKRVNGAALTRVTWEKLQAAAHARLLPRPPHQQRGYTRLGAVATRPWGLPLCTLRACGYLHGCSGAPQHLRPEYRQV
eukprot:5140874-Pleurochrysis_carterae.AAC.1